MAEKTRCSPVTLLSLSLDVNYFNLQKEAEFLMNHVGCTAAKFCQILIREHDLL